MTEALLTVEELSVSYGATAAVESISLEILPGRCLGVIGESGAGKTQAFLAMMGLLPRTGARCRPRTPGRAGPARTRRGRTSRPQSGDDLPGSDDVAHAAHACR